MRNLEHITDLLQNTSNLLEQWLRIILNQFDLNLFENSSYL